MKTIDDLIAHGLAKLDVYVKDKHVAVLSKEGTRYVLTYLPDANPDDYVSLSLPVRAESWVKENRLHPFFEMNLPEGVRRDWLAARYGKSMVKEEMALLALTGNDNIGRVSLVPSGFPLDWKPRCTIDVSAELKNDTAALLQRAIDLHAGQGVSGVQPKILAENVQQRCTLKADKWIIKYDGPEYPHLSINEFLCMHAARLSGLEVPQTILSDDRRALFVERFDKDGAGFEDFCSLFGLTPIEKYSSSMERMASIATRIVNHDRVKFKEEILRSVILNVCLGNSDAHLKNFGVLYDGNSTRFAPFYDIVSVRAYDEFRRDIPALTIGGKKEWVIGKAFTQFANSMGVLPKRTAQIINEVEDGVRKAMPAIYKMMEDEPPFRDIGKSMLMVWEAGLSRIRGNKVCDEHEREALKGMGFSEPLTKIPAKRTMRDDTMKPNF